MRLSASPVKELALERELEVFQPSRFQEPGVIERLRGLAPEAMVVAAYGLILPQSALEIATHGALNIHASLLPRWRGAAPIQRAILAGDALTGITIMQMDAGLDTGAMITQRAIPIAANETAVSLHERLAGLGAQMIVEVLRQLEAGGVHPVEQPAEGRNVCAQDREGRRRLDWRKTSVELDRMVRAFNPFPGAHAMQGATSVKVWRAYPAEGSGAPGSVQSAGDDGIVVACGQGTLVLTELQRAGAKRLGARDFLRGHPLVPGTRFALPD